MNYFEYFFWILLNHIEYTAILWTDAPFFGSFWILSNTMWIVSNTLLCNTFKPFGILWNTVISSQKTSYCKCCIFKSIQKHIEYSGILLYLVEKYNIVNFLYSKVFTCFEYSGILLYPVKSYCIFLYSKVFTYLTYAWNENDDNWLANYWRLRPTECSRCQTRKTR